MIKLIAYDGGEIGNLLYDKYIPRQGDYIKFEDNNYRVEMVTFDDDDGVVKILVRNFVEEVCKNYAKESYVTSNKMTIGELYETK